MLVVGFIAGPLTRSASFNGTDLRNCVIVGIIFGILSQQLLRLLLLVHTKIIVNTVS